MFIWIPEPRKFMLYDFFEKERWVIKFAITTAVILKLMSSNTDFDHNHV